MVRPHAYRQRALAAGACREEEARSGCALSLGGLRAQPTGMLVDEHHELLLASAVDLLERLDATAGGLG